MSGARRRACAAGPLILAGVALGFSLVLGELLLRVAFPSYRFLDPAKDCFWVARLRHEMRTKSDGSGLYGSGQYDPVCGWKPQPNRRAPGENTNSRCIRGVREYAKAKPEGILRLVVHGDSFTWGFGVSDAETYAARLAALSPGVEAINLGVNGHGIDQQYLYWLSEGRGYEPDVVILGFFIPDFHRVALSVREYPKPRLIINEHGLGLVNCPVPRPEQFLKDWCNECQSKSRVLDLLAAARRKAGASESEDAAFRSKAALTKAILAAWKESAAELGAEFCLVIIPHQRFRDYPDHKRIEDVLQDSAKRSGFSLLNLSEPLQRFERSGVDAYQDDNGHWTAAAHAFAAHQITTLLRSTHVARSQ